MGLFNYVNYECECPYCGALVKGFQTKDDNIYPLELQSVSYLDICNFYCGCKECGAWIEFHRNQAKSIDDFIMSYKAPDPKQCMQENFRGIGEGD